MQLWKAGRCARENFIALVASEKLADVAEVEARPAEERAWMTRVFDELGLVDVHRGLDRRLRQ